MTIIKFINLRKPVKVEKNDTYFTWGGGSAVQFYFVLKTV